MVYYMPRLGYSIPTYVVSSGGATVFLRILCLPGGYSIPTYVVSSGCNRFWLVTTLILPITCYLNLKSFYNYLSLYNIKIPWKGGWKYFSVQITIPVCCGSSHRCTYIQGLRFLNQSQKIKNLKEVQIDCSRTLCFLTKHQHSPLKEYFCKYWFSFRHVPFFVYWGVGQ